MKGEAEVLENGTWVLRLPTAGAKGRCPGCRSEMIAKCGRHISPYWALKRQADSASGPEGKTKWHKDWQAHFPGCKEAPIKNNRADVLINGVVLEFQRKYLSNAELIGREQAYQNMLWVVDATRANLGKRFAQGLRQDKPTDDAPRTLDSGFTPNWIHPPFWTFVWGGTSKLFENWQHASKPVFLDFGEYYGFWHLLSYCAFVRMGIVAQVSPEDFLEAYGGSASGERSKTITFDAITPCGQPTEPWRFSEAKLRRRMRNRLCVDSLGCTLHKKCARSGELFCPESKKMDGSFRSHALFEYLTTR